jgi:hypothetical protein
MALAGMTETQFQIQCMKWLRSKGHLAIHVPNEGHRTAREASIAKQRGVLPGVSDILVLDIGAAIELKVGKGKPSRAQELFIEAVNGCGWTGGFAWTFDEMKQIYRRAIDGLDH